MSKIRQHKDIMMKALILLICICFPMCATGGPITGVTVRNADFEVTKVLTPEEIEQFEQQWVKKSKVDVQLRDVGGRHYKLDISEKGSGNRWLYQSNGYVQVLSVKVMHVYKMQDAGKFNELIEQRSEAFQFF